MCLFANVNESGLPLLGMRFVVRLCEAIFDWGGVSRDFWKDAVKNYGWDVDPASIETENDALFRERYHVFMRKNGSKEPNKRNKAGGG